MAPRYLRQRLIVPATKKSEPCYRGSDFLWSAKWGAAFRRRSAKLRACGEGHTPCGIATLLAATQREERWVSYFSLLCLCLLTPYMCKLLSEF